MKEEDLDSRIERVIREEGARRHDIAEWEEEWKALQPKVPDDVDWEDIFRYDPEERERRLACCAPPPSDSRHHMLAGMIPEPRVRRRRWIIPVVASAIVVLGLGISWYFRSGSTGEENAYSVPVSSSSGVPDVYRGGASGVAEIQAMMDSADYAGALRAIDLTLADTAVGDVRSADEREYKLGLIADRQYELTWMKINVLIRLDRTPEAVRMLNDYVYVEGEHQAEARKLYEDILKH